MIPILLCSDIPATHDYVVQAAGAFTQTSAPSVASSLLPQIDLRLEEPLFARVRAVFTSGKLHWLLPVGRESPFSPHQATRLHNKRVAELRELEVVTPHLYPSLSCIRRNT